MRDPIAIPGTLAVDGRAPSTAASTAPPPRITLPAMAGGDAPLHGGQSVAALLQHMEQVQREMDALRSELTHLRRRDETLNFYLNRIDEELRLAARLQQDFLPKGLPEVGPVRFRTLYRPAGYVSGDLYDVMRLDEKRVGFYMADAVGHGVPAALLTMFIKQALVTKEITPGGYRLLPPAESLARLNTVLVDQNLAHATFATALYGVIDVETLEVTIARAGHPAPMVIRGGPGGRIEPLQPEGGLLGVFPGETYDAATTRLNAGDRLFLYTDGIEVAFGGEAIDVERWERELRDRRDLTSEQLLAEFAAHLDAQSGSLAPKDDVTVILMDVTADAPAAAGVPYT
jgi:serine phosphatase RsbU (regulator of sigma subunit)